MRGLFLAVASLLACVNQLGAVTPSVNCHSKPQSEKPFCNPKLTPEERASNLVSLLTTDELIQQTWTIAPAISRLGINAYNWRSNCLHGWAASGGHWTSDLKWTVFPTPIGLAATFNKSGVFQVGAVTSDEGRALHNAMLETNDGASTEAAGLNCFSPNVNLFRDPRWGRGMETFGEDPYTLAILGTAYSNGLQRPDLSEKYVKVVACPKHYTVHSGPDQDRAHFTANTSLHDLYDTFLPAFKSQVMFSKVGQVMPAYSAVYTTGSEDGAPDCANKFLLKEVLRDQFGGYNISVVSDNGGVAMVYSTHHFVKTPEEAAAVSINATTDLDLGHDAIYSKYLGQALKDSLVALETIQQSVWRNFYWRIRLGDFDPAEMVPYQMIDKTHLNTPASQLLNEQVARESIVLLQNRNNLLPMSTFQHRITLIGPNANASRTQLGNYEGIPDQVASIYDGILYSLEKAQSHTEFGYAQACKDTACTSLNKTLVKEATFAASQAQTVVLVLGLSGHEEGEGHDRAVSSCSTTGRKNDVLGLPGCQLELLQAIVKAGRPVVLVLMNGGPLSVPWAVENVDTIVEAWYPGAKGGLAVADVLFGHYNPGGRMPVTTVMSSSDLRNSTDYSMAPSPGRTYKYFAGKPLFPFGWGLSYTTFTYSSLVLSSMEMDACKGLTVTATVTNSGTKAGDEVVQVYITAPTQSQYKVPLMSLQGFNRIHLQQGGETKVTFTIDAMSMSVVDNKGVDMVNTGSYTVYIGGHAPMQGFTDGILEGQFKVTGESTPLSKCTGIRQCYACSG